MMRVGKAALPYLAVVLACVAWLAGAGVTLWAVYFASDAKAMLAIMSSRSFIQVMATQFGLLVAAAALVLSAALLVFSKRTPMVFWSLALSGAYVAMPLALMLLPTDGTLEPPAASTAREWARLAPFPVPGELVQIQVDGSSFSREIRLGFKAPRASVDDWISRSSGLADAEVSREDGWMHYKIKPGGGAQFAEVRVQESSGVVRVRVYWS